MTCHTTAFPRLNYYGERFQRNGYQDVGTEDGDTTGKQKISDRLFIDEIGNLLGVRINVVRLRIVTNDLETGPGEPRTRVDVGGANWLQLFTAGSIARNISIFIETEIAFDGSVHNSWFRLGAHNLLGTKALNVWVGVMDPLELHAASGRLPMISPVRQDVFLVRSSNGDGDESLDLRTGRPAVAVYGSVGPVVYEVGVDNGPNLQDTNRAKNVWGTLRGELRDGALEGSSISVWGNWAEDSRLGDEVQPAQAKYQFWRISPAANLRWRSLDIIAAWVFASVTTKLGGLRHTWAYYVSGWRAPVELYRPYPNHHCVHCHSTRLGGFMEEPEHAAVKDELDREETSCVAAGCHGPPHPRATP